MGAVNEIVQPGKVTAIERIPPSDVASAPNEFNGAKDHGSQ